MLPQEAGPPGAAGCGALVSQAGSATTRGAPSGHDTAGASTSGGVQPATAIDRLVAIGKEQCKEQAVDELCMFFYTTETPFLRVENAYLIKAATPIPMVIVSTS